MSVNPLNIIHLLQKYFSKYTEETPISGHERFMAKSFAEEIERCIRGEEIEIYHDLAIDENAEYTEMEGEMPDFSDLDEDPDEEDLCEPESPFGSG